MKKGPSLKKDLTGSYKIHHLLLTNILLFTLGFFVYAPSLTYDFLFDDKPNILKSYLIKHGNFKTLFFKSTRWITNWLNTLYYSISKTDPFIYRLGNLLIHIIGATIGFYFIFFTFKNLKNNSFSTKAYFIALLISIFFILHPVQTQTISYVIQGQCEGLACLFVLLILFLFSVYSYCQTRISKFISLISLVIAAIISCGTKEIAIVSPILVLLTDWFLIAQGNTIEMKSRLSIHFLLWLIVGTLYLYFLKPEFFLNLLTFNIEISNNFGNTLTENASQKINQTIFFFSQFKVILHYLWIFIWPFNLSADYGWKLVKNFFSLDCIIPLLFLILVIIYIVIRLKKNKVDIFSYGILWFFICILPRSSLIPGSELISDYKTYLPSFGIFVVFAYLLTLFTVYLESWVKNKKFYSNNISIPATLTVFLCVLFLAGASYSRNQIWSSGEKFWLNVVSHNPQNARGYNNYAEELIQKKEYNEAIKYLKKALKIDPKYAHAWINLGFIYYRIGDLDNAILSSYKSIEINPNCREAYNNLADFLRKKGNIQEAKKILEKVLLLNPRYSKALYQMGLIHMDLGKKEEGIYYFKKCCYESDFVSTHEFKMLGKAALEAKEYDEAANAFSKALEFEPNSIDCLSELGFSFYKSKKYKSAKKIYKQLIKQIPTNSYFNLQLAKCYYKIKKYELACKFFNQFLEIYPESPLIYLKLASSYLALNQIDKVKKTLDKLLSITQDQYFKNRAKKILTNIKD